MDEMDLEMLRELFLEEAREHVDTLERGLLAMSQQDASKDVLDEVFRAAHSIKGGGATFGFEDLAELTHHMETLLDQLRSGAREVTEPVVELLLEGLDMVRELMERIGEDDHPDRLALQGRLIAAVSDVENENSSADSEEPPEETPGSDSDRHGTWRVVLKPKPGMLGSGNDPFTAIKALHQLGDVSVQADTSWLPDWEFLDPCIAYMPVTADIRSAIEESSIREVFEWIEDDCSLTVSRNVDQHPDTEQITSEAETADVALPAQITADSDGPENSLTKESKSGKPNAKKAAAPEASIRVSTEKIDQIINLVGELVINQSMLSGLATPDESIDVDALTNRLSELERTTRQLQEGVMRVRMLPLSMGFGRLPRLVRDLSKKLDKPVDLVIEGADTEIDKTVLEQMMDPLVHLVRNAIDHGLETREERNQSGKRKTGVLKLSAYHQSGSVVIEISDDGRGINPEAILAKAVERGIVSADDTLSEAEINHLLFAPGFSTAESVSDVSGRGVGMDVVRRNIADLSGQVDISSKLGSGTKVTIRLPLTLAILEGQLISCGGETFVIPLANMIETIEADQCNLSELPGRGSVFLFRGEYLQLVDMANEFELQSIGDRALIVVIECHGKLYGLLIDKVLGQQQIVIKSLEENYQSIEGIAGATIMSDGSVALILDTARLIPTARMGIAA